MIIIDYDFLPKVISDQQLKITFKKSWGPPLKKSTSPFLFAPLNLKIQKLQVSPFFFFLKSFSHPPHTPCKKAGTLWNCSGVRKAFCKIMHHKKVLFFQKNISFWRITVMCDMKYFLNNDIFQNISQKPFSMQNNSKSISSA